MTLALLTFSGLMWIAQFSPGPDMLLLLKNAINHPRSTALATVAGIVCGLVGHSLAILSGLAVTLRQSPGAFHALRLAGGAYLLYLGVRLVLSVRRATVDVGVVGSPADPTIGGAFTQGLMTNLLNAKAVLFLLGAFAAFHPPGSPPWLKWALGGIVIAQAAIGWGAFVCLLGWPPVRTWFLRWQRPWNAAFGALLIAAGVAALWSQA